MRRAYTGREFHLHAHDPSFQSPGMGHCTLCPNSGHAPFLPISFCSSQKRRTPYKSCIAARAHQAMGDHSLHNRKTLPLRVFANVSSSTVSPADTITLAKPQFLVQEVGLNNKECLLRSSLPFLRVSFLPKTLCTKGYRCNPLLYCLDS